MRKKARHYPGAVAETQGVSQQTLQPHEAGRRRIRVAALRVVARTLKVSLEELFGGSKRAARSKRGRVSKLEHHLERIGSGPKPRQRADRCDRGHARPAEELRMQRRPCLNPSLSGSGVAGDLLSL